MNTEKRKEIFYLSFGILYSIYIVLVLGLMLAFGVIMNQPELIKYQTIFEGILLITLGITTLIMFLAFIINVLALRLLQFKIVNRKKYKEFKSNEGI